MGRAGLRWAPCRIEEVRLKIQYHPETDILEVELKTGIESEGEEVAPGFVLRRGTGGEVVDVGVSHRASEMADLRTVRVVGLPVISVAPLLAATFREAVGAFEGDAEAAGRWFRSPVPALGGAVPRELAETGAGAREVGALIRGMGRGTSP